MNATQLLAHFDRLAEAPEAVPRLRRFILDLAVRGKLVEQDASDEPGLKLLHRIQIEKARPLKKGVTRKTVDAAEVSEDSQLFVIPSSWVGTNLAGIADFSAGRTPSRHETVFWNSGDYPWVSIRDMRAGETLFNTREAVSETAKLKVFGSEPVPAGTLIMSFKLTIGRISRLGIPAFHNEAIISIRPHLQLLDPYLFKVLPLFAQSGNSKDAIKGATLNRESLSNIPIALPPLAEQHRIVAKVDELMALCDQLEAALQERELRRDRLAAASLQRLNQPAADTTPEAQRDHARFHLHHLPRLTTRPEHIKAMRQTILNLAVQGLLVPQDANDEPAKVLLNSIREKKAQLARLGAIPKEKTADGAALLTFALPTLWQAVHLGDVCNLVTSGSRGWAEFYAESGPKFLRAQNIRFGRLRLEELACVTPPAQSEGARTQVQQSDLLIVITGAGVTNPALLDRDLGEAYVSQHVALVRPTNTDLSRWLLLCLMAGPSGRDELVERAYGAGKPGLNLDNIRSLSTPIPPLAEQHRIVAKVDELMALCDQLEDQLTTAQTDSRRLLEAVLEAALAPA